MATYEGRVHNAREEVRDAAKFHGWTEVETGPLQDDRYERNGLTVEVRFSRTGQVSWANLLKGIQFVDGTGRTQKRATVLGWLRA